MRDGGIHRRPEPTPVGAAWQVRGGHPSPWGGNDLEIPAAIGTLETMALIRRSSAGVQALLALAVFLGAKMAPAQAAPDSLAARTVVLVNANEPESVALGRFYLDQRGIPAANLVALPMSGDEHVTWRMFVDEVWQPLQDTLLRRGWLEGVAGNTLDPAQRRRLTVSTQHIAYLVVCRGVPLAIEHDPTLLSAATTARLPGQEQTNQGAVDSELSLLAAGNYEINGFVANPLFAGRRALEPDAQLVVKVARLDGPDFADARNLVSAGLAAESAGVAGRFYVDLKGPIPEGDRWLEETGHELEQLGFDGDYERTPAVFGPGARFDAPVFYFGWYAGDVAGVFLRPDFHFPPGAIALHIHSFSARTLHSRTEGWCGPLVARGVTATMGNVFEPYLQFTHRPDLLVQALARGDNLGDAAYFAMPVLSWQGVVIGDPLFRPLAAGATPDRETGAELEPYRVLRRAHLLAHSGRLEDADALLAGENARHPGLVLMLGWAELARLDGPPKAALTALAALAGRETFTAEEWPLAREAAKILCREKAAPAGLAVYSALARSSPPGPEPQREMLVEARSEAQAAGDPARESEFDRALEKLAGR